MNQCFYWLALVGGLAIAGCQSIPPPTDFESSRARSPQDKRVEVFVDDRIESLPLSERIRQATLEALSRCGFQASDSDSDLVVLVTAGRLPDSTSSSRTTPRPTSIAVARNEGMSQAELHTRRQPSIFEQPPSRDARIGLLWSAIESRHFHDTTGYPEQWPRVWRAFASVPTNDEKWSTTGPLLVESLRKCLSESWKP